MDGGTPSTHNFLSPWVACADEPPPPGGLQAPSRVAWRDDAAVPTGWTAGSAAGLGSTGGQRRIITTTGGDLMERYKYQLMSL